MKHHRLNYDISADIAQLIERSQVNLQLLRGRTVFLTGGTGFFGVWFLSALLRIRFILNGDLNLVVLSRDPEKFLKDYSTFGFQGHIKFVEGDVRDFKITDLEITDLVHMATTNASETYAGEDQLHKLDMLYRGTRNVLEQCGESLERVLFTSSGVVYGNTTKELISEDDPVGPATTELGSALAIGKLAAEYTLAYYAGKYRFNYAIARCFAFAGQYLPLDLHYAFGNFIANAISGEEIVIKGDGKDKRSYLYIGDAIAWMLRLLAEPNNQIYNIGSPNAISMESLARKIANQSEKRIGVSIRGGVSEVGNFRRSSYTPMTSKVIDSYSGLAEWTTLDEIIKKMISCQKIAPSA